MEDTDRTAMVTFLIRILVEPETHLDEMLIGWTRPDLDSAAKDDAIALREALRRVLTGSEDDDLCALERM